MEWTIDEDGLHTITSENPPCLIWIIARPPYCDRGNWLAHLEPDPDPRKIYIDAADLWPRYYFDLERAKLEIEAWLEKRAKR